MTYIEKDEKASKDCVRCVMPEIAAKTLFIWFFLNNPTKWLYCCCVFLFLVELFSFYFLFCKCACGLWNNGQDRKCWLLALHLNRLIRFKFKRTHCNDEKTFPSASLNCLFILCKCRCVSLCVSCVPKRTPTKWNFLFL